MGTIRDQFYYPVQDQAGNTLANVQVTIQNWAWDDTTNTEVLSTATVYSGLESGGTVTQPYTTDATGEVIFYANPGYYKITMHDANLPPRVADKVLYWGSLPAQPRAIDLGFLTYRGTDPANDHNHRPLNLTDVDIFSGVQSGAWYGIIGSNRVGNKQMGLDCPQTFLGSNKNIAASDGWTKIIAVTPPQPGRYIFIGNLCCQGATTAHAAGPVQYEQFKDVVLRLRVGSNILSPTDVTGIIAAQCILDQDSARNTLSFAYKYVFTLDGSQEVNLDAMYSSGSGADNFWVIGSNDATNLIGIPYSQT